MATVRLILYVMQPEVIRSEVEWRPITNLTAARWPRVVFLASGGPSTPLRTALRDPVAGFFGGVVGLFLA